MILKREGCGGGGEGDGNDGVPPKRRSESKEVGCPMK